MLGVPRGVYEGEENFAATGLYARFILAVFSITLPGKPLSSPVFLIFFLSRRVPNLFGGSRLFDRGASRAGPHAVTLGAGVAGAAVEFAETIAVAVSVLGVAVVVDACRAVIWHEDSSLEGVSGGSSDSCAGEGSRSGKNRDSCCLFFGLKSC